MKQTWKHRLAAFGAAGALALAMAPAAAFGVGALTADTKITVTGISGDATVTAYKFVEVDQTNTSTDGTAGWKFVDGFGDIDGVTLAGLIGTDATIDPTEAAKIANVATGDGISLTKSAEGDYVATTGVTAGLYIVKIVGTGSTIYNPVIVGADYDQSNSSNAVNAGSTYSGNTAVAKSSEPTLTKTVDDAAGDNAVQANDTVAFTISTVVPYYPAPYYSSPTFVVTDTVSAGLSLPDEKADVVVKANNDTLTEGTDYTWAKNGQTMTVTFTAAYLQNESRTNKGGLDGGTTPITVKYSAKVSDVDEFQKNVNEMTNDANITFTNNPGTTKDSDHVKTHHYTFGLDADLAGGSSGSDKSKELRKIAVDSTEGAVMFETASQSQWSNQTPLAGAVFTLTGTSSDGVAYSGEYTTDSDGHITFTGLDANIEYTLKETSAPVGYQLDSTEHKIKITPTYVTGSDVLASYTVSIDGHVTATISLTNDGDEVESVTYADNSLTGLFKNVKAGILPATGGSGILFYVFIGAAIMALAIVLSRRGRKANGPVAGTVA